MPHPLTPCLWFDGQAEAAARFYCAIFPNSRITRLVPFGAAGTHNNKPADAVLSVEFVLDGRPFSALNGGPQVTINAGISFQVPCDTQAEIDRIWDALLAGGGQPSACGWLTDRFGVSWQVFPTQLLGWLADPDPARAARAMEAMMAMVKMDLAALRRAFEG